MSTERGMSAIEVLVGLVIGMIAAVVLFQVLLVAEGQRRTTTSGVDAHVSGSVGVFLLERDLMHAGFGIARLPTAYQGCELNADPVPFQLRPVRVVTTPGRPDTIDVVSGNSSTLSDPVAIGGSTASTKSLYSAAGFFPRDRVLLVNASGGNRCAFVTVSTGASAVDLPTRTIRHTESAFVTGAGAVAVDLGPRPRLVRWFVTGDELRVRDMLDPSDTRGRVVANGVVDLRAQYAIDRSGAGGAVDGRIADDEWTFTEPATPDDWSRLLGVRVAVLMRASNVEKPGEDGKPVTTVTPAWPSAGVEFRMPAESERESRDAPAQDWRNYRYRVYESSLVLRNAIWGR